MRKYFILKFLTSLKIVTFGNKTCLKSKIGEAGLEINGNRQTNKQSTC